MKQTTKIKITICFVTAWMIGMLCWASVLEWENETGRTAGGNVFMELKHNMGTYQVPYYTSLTIHINNKEMVFECLPGEKFYNNNEIIGIKLPENGDTGFYQDDGIVYFCLAGVRVDGWSMSCKELKEMFCQE